ncbi:CD177 antigen-like [Cricetulus griseus]|uniref:CD177 antigen-like n=1 Tax=Cricetulus griseus TaxID=10029 RepID=A0A9J7JY71_CRIGR|nr:CD177 antigen-like [Cricetulus griseus]
MAACFTHCLLLVFLVGFTPYSGTLKCYSGNIVEFGGGFAQETVKWSPKDTIETGPNETCQETFLMIDVGPKSLLVGSKGPGQPGEWKEDRVNLYSQKPGIVAAVYTNFCEESECNNATSDEVLVAHIRTPDLPDTSTIKCPICLTDENSCPNNLAYCPNKTVCYSGSFKITGGGVNKIFYIKGCLDSTAPNIFKREERIGIFSVVETAKSLTANSFSHLFVPGTSLAWVLGLGLFLTLHLSGFVFSDEPVSMSFLVPVGPHTLLSSAVIT